MPETAEKTADAQAPPGLVDDSPIETHTPFKETISFKIVDIELSIQFRGEYRSTATFDLFSTFTFSRPEGHGREHMGPEVHGSAKDGVEVAFPIWEGFSKLGLCVKIIDGWFTITVTVGGIPPVTKRVFKANPPKSLEN